MAADSSVTLSLEQPVHAAIDPVPDEQRHQPAAQHQIKPGHLAGKLHGRQRPGRAFGQRRLRRDAQRAAGVVAQADDDQPGDLGERQGHQREIVADNLEAEARIADHEGHHQRDDERHHRADPGRDAVEIPQQHHGVGADAQEGAVAEAHQTQATHDRPAGVDERPQQGHHHQVQRIVAHAGERHDERQGQQTQSQIAHVHRRFDRSPSGFQNMVMMKNTKAIT
ncbi:MAG: hypothetical protein NTV19_07875 [Burkholderiales bacterium]|nr:hypothetical protein [Burkholderiales bacterium]